MTNPVDSSGNVAVDFVWGNFPLQPDDVRQTSPSQTTTAGGDQNVGWTYVSTKPSAKLAENNISVTLNQLTQTVAPDNHIIAYQGWDSYPATDGKVSTAVTAPAWSPIGYSIGSGVPTTSDTVIVPDIMNLSYKGAIEALHYAGLDVGTVTFATSANDVATLSNVALTSNVVTLTTAADHGFLVGESVVIAALVNGSGSASADASVNGTYTITAVPSSTTFRFAKTASNITTHTVSAGTATVTKVANASNSGLVVAQGTATGTSTTKGSSVNFTVERYQDASTPGIAGSSGYVAG